MLTLKLSKQAAKFLQSIPAKHAAQISKKIVLLQQSPDSLPTKVLKGYAPWRRAKSGEYRIIYSIDNSVLHIVLVGKRNDDEVYKILAAFFNK